MRSLPAILKTIIKTVSVGGGGLLIVNHLPLLASLAAGLLTALYIGVVLPAVWSTHSTRRMAALTVLIQILATLIQSRDSKPSTPNVHAAPASDNRLLASIIHHDEGAG